MRQRWRSARSGHSGSSSAGTSRSRLGVAAQVFDDALRLRIRPFTEIGFEAKVRGELHVLRVRHHHVGDDACLQTRHAIGQHHGWHADDMQVIRARTVVLFVRRKSGACQSGSSIEDQSVGCRRHRVGAVGAGLRPAPTSVVRAVSRRQGERTSHFQVEIEAGVRSAAAAFRDNDVDASVIAALRLWWMSRLRGRRFAPLIQQAREATQKRISLGKVEHGEPGRREAMPYFFAVLRDLVDQDRARLRRRSDERRRE